MAAVRRVEQQQQQKRGGERCHESATSTVSVVLFKERIVVSCRARARVILQEAVL